MQHDLTVAVAQMNSGEDRDANLAEAERLVRQAAAGGARLVVLPEYFNRLGDRRAMLAGAEPIPGQTSAFLADLARTAGITLVGGTFCEALPAGDDAAGDKAHNTCLIFDAAGQMLARYRKRHLFDVRLPNLTYCESEWLAPGDEITACAAEGACVAPAVCYDVRFPEQFRRMADLGASIVALPAAFTKATGRDHWHLLLRARAVENQCFVVAANQTGRHAALETFGHSLIIDPWGEVLADAGEGPGIATAVLSAARLAEIRERLPALQHRRRDS
jgi:deaminated glutathione amidase